MAVPGARSWCGTPTANQKRASQELGLVQNEKELIRLASAGVGRLFCIFVGSINLTWQMTSQELGATLMTDEIYARTCGGMTYEKKQRKISERSGAAEKG